MLTAVQWDRLEARARRFEVVAQGQIGVLIERLAACWRNQGAEPSDSMTRVIARRVGIDHLRWATYWNRKRKGAPQFVEISKRPESEADTGLPLSERLADVDAPDPRDVVEDDLHAIIRGALTGLDRRERLVLESCLVNGERYRPVADKLGITAARVCQIRATALRKLRVKLQVRLPELFFPDRRLATA